ncbi:MAG: AMP-binding protein [Labilithrix sp.]|nr:AMP-binding protein [Labilithrix sp.]
MAPYLLHHLLERAAAGAPEKEAVVDGERRLTYADLHAWAGAVAAWLEADGLRRRDRVGVYLDKSAEEAAAIFGASMAGGVFVPIHPALKPLQVSHILADCQVRHLVTTAARRDALASAGALASVEHELLVPGPDAELAGHPLAGAPGRAARSACIGEDLAALLYTSGSTGRPKGVMLSHRNLLAGSRIVSAYLAIGREDRVLSVLPFSFDYGLNQLVTTVEHEATIALLRSFRFGDEIVRALAAERVTGLAGVPTLWSVLAHSAPSLKKTTLPHLRYITNSGGALTPEISGKLQSLLPTTKIFAMYGLTEAFRSTFLPPEELARRPTSMGKAIPETEVFALHESGRACLPGEEGILVHRGPTVSLGYWNRPDATREVLVPNPLVDPDEGADVVCVSGDVVRMDEDGFFHFVGRRDGMIKCSGFRVSPTEVEEVLMASGVLAQAAVIGLPDPNAGERVHALCVAAPGSEPAPEALRARCAELLPLHMQPKDFEYVAELPRSPNGKVDYRALRAERTTPR